MAAVPQVDHRAPTPFQVGRAAVKIRGQAHWPHDGKQGLGRQSAHFSPLQIEAIQQPITQLEVRVVHALAVGQQHFC